MASSAYMSSRQCPQVRTKTNPGGLRRHRSIRDTNTLGRGQLNMQPQETYDGLKIGPKSPPLIDTTPHNASGRIPILWSPSHADDDDDLYSLTGDESYRVPIFSSKMAKNHSPQRNPRYPALMIPSHAKLPSKLPDTAVNVSITTPPMKFNTFRRLRTPPSRMTTPSLDGSLTSEELASSSCPSTPELELSSPTSSDLDMPVQLDSAAYALLCKLSSTAAESESSHLRAIPVISQDALNEMREIANPGAGVQKHCAMDLAPSLDRRHSSASEPGSAMTVPSPGAFFGSLGPLTRQTWCPGSSPPAPSTGTAENFYRVPWRNENPERVTIPRVDTSQITALAPSLTSETRVEVAEITPGAFVRALPVEPEAYERRTKEWLYDQWAWTTSFAQAPSLDTSRVDEGPKTVTPPARPTTPPSESVKAPASTHSTQSKKSVRILESVPEVAEPEDESQGASRETIFYDGFCSLTSRTRPKDAFMHRQARAEACHVRSSSFPSEESATIRNEFLLSHTKDKAAADPDFLGTPSQPEDVDYKETVAKVERERNTLEQIQPCLWELQAAQQVFGPDLISSPVSTKLVAHDGLRILDYGGGASCNWGWGAALRYRNSVVFTVPMNSAQSSCVLAGPPNHKVIRATSSTSLPFPGNYFDLISARSLHAMLHTYRPDPVSHPDKDEYDMVLAELLRVLKPGGYLDFHLMDASLFHAGPQGTALGKDFVDTLGHKSYDANASRYFLPRLRNAGFADIKRAWIVLPATDVVPTWVDTGKRLTRQAPPANGPINALPETPLVGSTRAVQAMTGLIGARAWERWVVTLQREVGGDEEAMLARVARVMEESGRVGAGWRCLVGWARK